MGERFYPEQYDASYFEHFHRYLVTKELTKDKVVLDIACGEGYGSEILSETSKKVTAVDIDEESIEIAKKKYKHCNIDFITANVYSLPFIDNQFDVVVCFETIEHIEQPERAIEELSRVLEKDGILIISTPNKSVYTDSRNFNNPFHLHEFNIDDFNEMLKTRFHYCKIYGQRMIRSSFICSKENEFRDVDFIENSEIQPMYYIAICSNNPIENININSQYTNEFVDEEIEQAKKVINNQTKEIEQAKKVINNQTEEIEQAKEIINNKSEEIQQAKKIIESHNMENENVKNLINKKDDEIKNARETINDFYKNCNNMESEVDFSRKEIILLKKMINEKENQLQVISETINFLNSRNKEMQEELDIIKKTFMYKFINLFRKQ